MNSSIILREESHKDYINIGTEKCAVFVRMSKKLLNLLKTYPLLHYAIEEGVLSAEDNKYFAASIMAFSQLLNALGETTPRERHLVAHEFLKIRPEENSYREIGKKMKIQLENIADKELTKAVDKDIYFNEMQKMWKEIYNR